jgi:pSer/pThr/pTyr-binding forkhead associated (FHA) protein
MHDSTVREIGDSSSQQPPVQHTKHIGLLGADSIVLYLNDASDPFFFPLTQEITLGRQAPDASIQTFVDLTLFGAHEKGVSRLHAVIRRTPGGNVEVEDLASANGTWLNGLRMAPHLPRPLKSGDRLTLGQFIVYIYLAETESKAEESTAAKAPARNDVPVPSSSVASELPVTDKLNPVMPLLLPAPKPLEHYHATVSLGLQYMIIELGSVLAKIIPPLLQLKDCEIKFTLHIDAHVRSGFDESTIQTIKNAAGDLKLDESEFGPTRRNM